MSGKEIENAKTLARQKELHQIPRRSIVPDIRGHEYGKQGLLMLLFGVLRRSLRTGPRFGAKKTCF